MKKIIFIAACAILVLATAAYSAPQPPPQGHGGQYGQPGPGGDRREAWLNFAKQNPQDAETIMRICKEHPELGCPFQQGPGGPGGMGPGGPGGMGPGGPGGMGPGGMGPEDDDLMGPGMGRPQMNPEIMEKMKKMQDLKMQVRELAKKYNATQSADERKKLETQIRGMLDEIYVLKLDLMRKRITDVESKLNEVKIEMKRYEVDRKGVVDSWFNQLAGQDRYKRF